MARKLIAAVCGAILTFCLPFTVFCGDTYNKELTKGEVLKILLDTAPYYTPYISAEDIVSGYAEGEFREDKLADDTEMLVMISRAFPTMAELDGRNYVLKPEPAQISGLPVWAQKHFDYLNERGIISQNTVLDDSVTRQELDTYLRRVWCYYASNPKDDFYACINSESDDKGKIKVNTGVIDDMQMENNEEIKNILSDIIEKKPSNSCERKIGYIYSSALKMLENGNVKPIKGCFSRLENAKNTKQLMQAALYCDKDICSSGLFEFGLMADVMDTDRYIPYFDAYTPVFDYADYADDKYKAAYIEYVKKLFVLGGDSGETAEHKAEKMYAFEKGLSYHCLTKADRKIPGRTYNKITFDELCGLYDFADLKAFAQNAGIALKPDDEIVIPDMGLVYNIAVMCKEDPVTMKAAAQLSLLDEYGVYLAPEFTEVSRKFWAETRGGNVTDTQGAERARDITAAFVSDHLENEYRKKFLSEEDAKAVEQLTRELIKVYKQKIDRIDWMSDSTKKKAKKKLDTIKIKVGGETSDKFIIDNANITSLNSLFKNYIATKRAKRTDNKYIRKNNICADSWKIPSYWANAAYIPQQNAIELPAGIIRKPFYSADRSFEENMGSIGVVIAHELSHAFDNNGALCDENGCLDDWWTAEDYIKFSEKCTDIADFYDGFEAAADIPTDGMRTLGENIADLGGLSCAVEAVKNKGGELKPVFESYARSRKSLYVRSYMEYISKYEEHAADNVRVNISLANNPDFAAIYGIKEGDGMYVSPEKMIGLW